MKRTTIKDIARKLNVNPSTVSRALKDHPDIGPGLRQEIKKLAEEMHYRPNQMAVQLRQRQSHLVGLILPELTMFFYPSVIKGIHDVLHKKGYHAVIMTSNESPERELENIRICEENEMAGILLSLSRYTRAPEHLNYLQELDIPIVLVDKILEDLPFNSVLLADVDSAICATEHLIRTGCRRIGGLFGNPNLLITQLRVDGFKTALQRAGLPFEEQFVRFADNSLEARRCAEEILSLPVVPDGIFAMSDEIIIGAMPAIAQSGLHIPEECSVICISDGFLPYCLQPQVSFLHHDGVELGSAAAETLLKLIQSGSEIMTAGGSNGKLMLKSSLVELSTTRRL